MLTRVKFVGRSRRLFINRDIMDDVQRMSRPAETTVTQLTTYFITNRGGGVEERRDDNKLHRGLDLLALKPKRKNLNDI